jgi:hypothetical protein
MTRTFLVAVDLESSTDIDSMAAEILDSLTLDGIPATSCKPWSSAITEPESDSGFQLPTLPQSFLAPR